MYISGALKLLKKIEEGDYTIDDLLNVNQEIERKIIFRSRKIPFEVKLELIKREPFLIVYTDYYFYFFKSEELFKIIDALLDSDVSIDLDRRIRCVLRRLTEPQKVYLLLRAPGLKAVLQSKEGKTNRKED